MIADDHAGLAESLTLAFRAWFDVFPPVTSLQLIPHIVAAVAPDVLLLDLSFGREWALHSVRTILAASPRTRIVIFTNHDEGTLPQLSFAQGAHGFLVKVSSLEVIRREIERVASQPLASLPPAAGADVVRVAPKLPREERRALLHWLLAAGLPHKRIAKLTGIKPKSIEYHSARLRTGTY